MPKLYIGLMSGTSLDGIDAALVSIDANQFHVLQAFSATIPSALRAELLALCQGCDREIDRLGAADRLLGAELAKSALAVCGRAGISPDKVCAIGSHGQTIRHRPPSTTQAHQTAFTLQIGDPNTVAEHTGITTVSDFRRRDVAAGGQGAPLVPAFHAAAFSQPDTKRVIVNIGGMANVTVLEGNNKVSGFDTGPGNVLMDAWIQKNQHKPYDENGQWAASGVAIPVLIEHFLSDDYFLLQGPKSTGREKFNLQALEAILDKIPAARPEDIQHSLLQITAQSIVKAIHQHAPGYKEIYVCGGGAHNRTLTDAIEGQLPGCSLHSTRCLDIEPDWVEAVAFAWLAHQTLENLPGNLAEVTGASGPRILGTVCPA